MKIDYAGRVWDFDVEDVTTDQCEAIEKYTGAKGIGDWSNQLAAGNTKAVVALWWLMRKQAGEATGPISQPGEDFRPVKLIAAFNAAQLAELAAVAAAAEADEAAEPDPTLRPGSSPASAGTAMTPAPGGDAGLSLPG